METIILNNKTYILKKEYDKLKKTHNDPKYEESIINLTNRENTMGMGSAKLTGDWKVVNVSIDYLEKCIKSFKLLETCNEYDSINLVIGNNVPLGLGKVKKDMFSGIIIAPRVED